MPMIHTPSPLKYGPVVDPAKRKKNRLYCDGCGLEYILPHMLHNHRASGLCPGSPSSSSKSGFRASRRVCAPGDSSVSSSRELENDDAWRTRSADQVAEAAPDSPAGGSDDEKADGAGKEEDGAGAESPVKRKAVKTTIPAATQVRVH